MIGSRGFFRFVMGLFIVQSIWIAFSALYPQAFDEDFHFGLIKTYSHYWLPFLTKQPPNANAYGAVARDPSYLYHYLMSFPFRFIELFTSSQTTQVICLRIIDIGLFAVGLYLFRKLLLRTGLSTNLANVSLLIFTLIPIVPQLAAQISYDDLLFPLIAWICLQGFDITDRIRKHKIPSARLIVFGITIILTGIVKYASLPISMAVVLFLAWQIYLEYKLDFKKIWKAFKTDFKKHSPKLRIILVLLLLVSIGMFLERDGVNVVKYHKIEPNCAKVLSVKQCQPYSAWYVNYVRHEYLVGGQYRIQYNFIQYSYKWFYWMWYRLFFAVNGPTSGFANKSPLPVPSLCAVVLAAISLFALLRSHRKIYKDNPYLVMLTLVILVYSAVLFTQGYVTYRYTAVLENMNGRYLLPILLPLAAIMGLALSEAFRKAKVYKPLIVIVVLLLFLQGGGVLTFILSSDKTWYWDNKTIVKVNKDARSLAKSVVIKGKR
jgi:uncharacterized membrane protein YwzB